MKVSSTYLEYLLKQKQVQKLESQVQALEAKIRDLKGELRVLERLQPSAPSQEEVRTTSHGSQVSDPVPVQPWGEYILLILLTSLLVGTGLAM